MTLDSIRKTIPNEAVLIEFALYHPTDENNFRYVAYVIANWGKYHSKELGVANEIDKAVDDLRRSSARLVT